MVPSIRCRSLHARRSGRLPTRDPSLSASSPIRQLSPYQDWDARAHCPLEGMADVRTTDGAEVVVPWPAKPHGELSPYQVRECIERA
jgi:hypothetical protein